MLLALSIASCCTAAIPAVLTLLNLQEYQPPPALLPGNADEAGPPAQAMRVSLCIPARDEAAGIAHCVRGALAAGSSVAEVIVVDDHSTDGTGEIVAAMGREDARVRLLRAPALPAGWNGKQHACWTAAQASTAPLLCFLDADVRLEPGAMDRTAALQQQSGAALLSGFPREETGTWLEKLLLPLIHFLLLGFLPLALLRRTRLPGFAAGCGQFLLVERVAYFASGGHAAIRHTMHDGVKLPRLFREHGYSTRLTDLTDLTTCRMYHSATTTWRGLAKNATEGMAAPGAILPFTLLLGLGQVLPVPLLLAAMWRVPAALPWAWGAVVLSYLPRLLEVSRFQQNAGSVAAHPVGVLTLLALQWYAFGRKLLRRPAQWKAREYTAN